MNLKLRVQLLGDFRLSLDETPVYRVDTPRLQALIAFLLLHQHAPQSRHFVAFLFWPDSVEEQALTNLRNLLHALRHTLPCIDQFLHIDAKSLHWQPDVALVSDVGDMACAVARAGQAELTGDRVALRSALESITDLYRGDLLPSCYDDWILPERERLRQVFVERLAQLAELLESQRDYDAAVVAAQRLLRADPMHEATYRQLMRLYALSGNRAAAMRMYHTCATTLQQEFGVGPDPLTRETYKRLLREELPSTSEALTHVELPTIAPLIGREHEFSVLQVVLRAAVAGGPRLAILSGEAGIGKTRLAEELLLLADRQAITTAVARCYAAQGELPYAPVATWLRALPQPKVGKAWMTEGARLLPELRSDMPAAAPPDSFAEPWQRQRLFEGLSHMTLDGRRSLVLLLDDVQWCDRSTLEWLHYLLRFDPQARLLVVGTLRVENLPDNDALAALLGALRQTDLLTEIELGPLDEGATFALANRLSGGDLDPSLAHPLHLGSDGNPLFIVEMARMGAIDGRPMGAEHGENVRYASFTLPPKVRMVLEARLAQLSPSARELASLAAIVGREFTFALLALASHRDEDTFVRDLDELWGRRIIREQGADVYDFSHDRLREVANDALSAARRRLLHHHIAQALEVGSKEGRGAEFAQIATHYDRAGYPEQAILYYQRAGEVAQRTFAYEEAVSLYSRALELLRATPMSLEHDQREVELLLALGVPMILSRGHPAPEVVSVYTQAWELSERLPDSPRRFSVLVGLRRSSLGHGEARKAYDLGVEMIAQARRLADPALVARAYMHHAETLYRMGAFAQAVEHSIASYGLYDTVGHDPHLLEYGSDAGVFCLIYGAIALQYLGYLTRALTEVHRALSQAEKVNHPFTSCMAWAISASLHRLRRDVQATQAAAESALRIGEAFGFPLAILWGTGLKGWVLVQQGHQVEGIDQIRQGLTACHSTGYSMLSIDYLVTLCEVYVQSGNATDADDVLGEAFASMKSSELRCWDAELHRLCGELLLLRDDESGAETAFRQAIDIARQQQARLLELRASVCLSRLWHSQNRGQEARVLLEGIGGWFAEEPDTPDLIEARALLEALA